MMNSVIKAPTLTTDPKLYIFTVNLDNAIRAYDNFN